LFHLRVQNATGRVENPARFQTVRHEIARVKTVAREIAQAGSK
jgi:ribosomal protein L29